MIHYSSSEPASIQKLFNEIASNYDRTNDIVSFSLYRHWNKALAKRVLQNRPQKLLDLCSGTGAITYCILQESKLKNKPAPEVFLVDFSQNMLQIAQHKCFSFHSPLHYVEADALNLPFDDHLFDSISCGYGLRNIQDTEKALLEAYRVCAPGGSFCILELTRPKGFFFPFLHQFYLSHIVPKIGKWLSHDEAAYQWLKTSIDSFISPENFILMSKKIGWQTIAVKPLLRGIATIIELRR